MEQGEHFSDDAKENLRMENELLKIKLKGLYGNAFYMDTNPAMSPDQENRFLKSIVEFEDEYASTEYTTVYERLGKPAILSLEHMSQAGLVNALEMLNTILQKNDIKLNIIDGPYPNEVIYSFITEELFGQKIEKNLWQD